MPNKRNADEDRLSPYERIKEAILDATLEPGSALVESRLATWCDVSRTPVREALLRLEQDGLVERGPHGLVVRDRSPEEILDIYEVRIVLESTAARSAAKHHTDFDRIRLQGLLERSESVTGDEDGAHLASLNRQFHRGVWVASHNDSLLDLLARLDLHLSRYPATTLAYPGRWKTAIRDHQELVDAIVRRDANAAATIAEQHFVAARDIRLELWSQDTF